MSATITNAISAQKILFIIFLLKIFSYFATIRSQGAKITAISVKFRIIMQNTLYYKNVKKSIFFQNKFALRDFA
ncbi:MAG TPA: hypothetical protein DD628_07895 [Clostridiales bacterium]|nr:hypothetical protein [Candidatus Apopatosoma intestinale]